MDSRIDAAAVELFTVAQRRFQRLGGVDLARRAEADPDARLEAQKALSELGIAELDVRADLDQLCAGAMLTRAAGAVVLPWPVVPELLRVDDRLLVLVDPACVRIDHGALEVGWLAADRTGATWTVRAVRTGSTGRLGPFATTASLGEPDAPIGSADVSRYFTLQSWTVLGALERVVADVVAHLRARRQFGKALAEFQAIRFAMADVAVALRGLEQLAKLTTWRIGTAAEALADAMALRLHAADVAVTTLRSAHQFYGALGFCDETDLSVIDRHLQPTIRYPQSGERLAAALVPYVRDGVLTGAIR